MAWRPPGYLGYINNALLLSRRVFSPRPYRPSASQRPTEKQKEKASTNKSVDHRSNLPWTIKLLQRETAGKMILPTEQRPMKESTTRGDAPSPEATYTAEWEDSIVSSLPVTPGSGDSGFLHSTYANQQTLAGIGERWTVEEFGFRRGQFDRELRRTQPAPNPFSSRLNPYWFQAWRRGRMSREPVRADYTTPASPSLPNVAWTPLINPMTQTPEYPTGFFDAAFTKPLLVQALLGMGRLIARMLKHETEWHTLVPDIPGPMKQHLDLFPELKTWYDKMARDVVEARRGGMPWGYLERCLESADDPNLGRCVERYFEADERRPWTLSRLDTPRPVVALSNLDFW